jgi:hypothetical protein
MTDYKKLLELAKTRQAPEVPHQIKFPLPDEIDGKKIAHYTFFYYENWEEDEMTPEQLELRNMFRDGKLPNPFPMFEGDQVR